MKWMNRNKNSRDAGSRERLQRRGCKDGVGSKKGNEARRENESAKARGEKRRIRAGRDAESGVFRLSLRESMREADVEVILERAKEKYAAAKPRIIPDNGPQFIACDFKEFIRISGMTHVRTSPSYPPSNGKLERWHKSLKSECIRPGTPLSLEDAKRLIQQYVDRYNNVRLYGAIGYVTPKDMFADRQVEIQTERDRKLEATRQQRQHRRQQAV
jgi:putative transposase